MSSPSQYTPINENENSVPLTSIRSVDVRPFRSASASASSSSSRPAPRAQSTNRPLSSQEIQSFLTPPIIIESEKPRMGALAIGVLSVICCIVGLVLLSQTKSESETQEKNNSTGTGTGSSSSTNTSTIDTSSTSTSSHGYQLVGLFSLLLGIFSGCAFLLLLLSKSGKLKLPNCIDTLLA